MKGLKYIHSAGIMHRDIKPANVLLSEGCTLSLSLSVCFPSCCSISVTAQADICATPLRCVCCVCAFRWTFPPGDLKLCDFGLARGLEGEAADAFDDHRHPVAPVEGGGAGAAAGLPRPAPSPDW